ncbi:hypothetical protein BKA65DRAFT_490382 [Rhexocercosporidium sp. MPI-PUGE-AT-0058]|nr:hypothetical protein BKA65DRAFT_490382 [Rhexocercosporidium sp. MPI-PUGE-AT-0058]
MANTQPPTSSTTCCIGQQAFTSLQKLWNTSYIPQPSAEPINLPRISPARLTSTTEKTILYLAYGSNLSAETFKGARGIKPLSALNAHVPSLDLTFDLPGIPYIEPCFANTRYHMSPPTSKTDYHKDRWTKGLIGVVYEVTPEDYRTIIATEGGGASYHDVIVPCYALPEGSKTVDPVPAGVSFKAHTLLRPEPEEEEEGRATGGVVRPDPSYAQASARYLKLITSGGEEHGLPEEYMTYLYHIRPYTITTIKQKAGQAVILAVWVPILLFLFGLGKVFADDEGKIPDWLASVTGMFMRVLWAYYDMVLKKTCGDGERTIGDGEDEESGGRGWCEKSIMLE